ncbi:MAG: hypothetical protein QW292_14630 [Candidatus Parvarchaeota archaeon]
MVKIRKNASTDYYNGSKYCRKIVRKDDFLHLRFLYSLNHYGIR